MQAPYGDDERPILSRQEGKQRSSVCSWKPLTLSKRDFNRARSTDECTRNLCDVTNGPFGTVGRNKFPLKFEKLRRARDIANDSFAIKRITRGTWSFLFFHFCKLSYYFSERNIIWHRDALYEFIKINLYLKFLEIEIHAINIQYYMQWNYQCN